MNKPKDSVTLVLTTTPPFRLDLTAWALRRRPHNAVDRWDGTDYQRVLAIDGRTVAVAVQEIRHRNASAPPRLRVTVTGRSIGAEVKRAVSESLARMLGIHADLTGFYRLAARDRRLADMVRRFRGVKPPRFPSAFEGVVNGIACQQLSLTLGIHLLNRLAENFGVAWGTRDGLAHAFPRPRDLAGRTVGELRTLGLSNHKARAIIELSEAIVARRLDLEALAALNDQEALARLLELRGVGRWTAEYALLRGLGRTHIFPGDDVGARHGVERWLGLRKPLDYDRLQRVLRPRQPYAGLIYFHMLMIGLDEQGWLATRSDDVPR